MSKKAADPFIQLAGYYRANPKRWIRDNLWIDANGHELYTAAGSIGCCLMAGVIQFTEGPDATAADCPGPEERVAWSKLTKPLEDAIIELYPKFKNTFETIIDFNNHPSTTMAKVQRVLQRASVNATIYA